MLNYPIETNITGEIDFSLKNQINLLFLLNIRGDLNN